MPFLAIMHIICRPDRVAIPCDMANVTENPSRGSQNAEKSELKFVLIY